MPDLQDLFLPLICFQFILHILTYQSDLCCILSYSFTQSLSIFSLCLSIKALRLFMNALLVLDCVPAISFYKSSCLFLFIKSASCYLFHRHQVGPRTPDHASL